MSFKELLNQIKEEGSKASTSLQDVLAKCSEELGEANAEDLRARGVKPLKDDLDPIDERKDESIDLLLATLDLCLRQMDKKEMKTRLNKKLQKWMSYVK